MNISDLKNEIGEKTTTMWLLCFVTGYFYSFIWLIERYKKFNAIFEKDVLTRKKIISLMVGFGIVTLITSKSQSIISLGALGMIVLLIGFILSIIFLLEIISISLKIIKELDFYYAKNFKIDLKINKIYAVIFNIFYINYCINELEEIERKQNLLNK